LRSASAGAGSTAEIASATHAATKPWLARERRIG
jgi:hypothetical protein